MFFTLRCLALCSALALLPGLSSAQLNGPVGPLTTIAQKQAVKICNVLNYGAKADNTTDIGAPLNAAWNACIAGGVVVVPSGYYQIATPAALNGGNGVALQLDGIIYRSTQWVGGGNLIAISNANDVEMFSSRGLGAIQGFGYQYRLAGTTGPRLVRLTSVTNFAVHDFALADAPVFHVVLATCANGEVYNMAIRGGNQGGLDGIDVWGSNIHIHDIMVSNRDECVTTKSPSNNILVEQVYCNWSGGCALGSFAYGTNVTDVLYRKVYNWQTNQMFLIKNFGGNGTVKNIVAEDFIGHDTLYSLWLNAYWTGQVDSGGPGINLTNVTIDHWRGDCANGAQRGPITIVCSTDTPCTAINITDFAMWTNTSSSEFYTCSSAYGTGGCLQPGNGGNYSAIRDTITTPPAGYQAPYMPYDLAAPFSPTAYIPIPQMPAYFFPGTTPLKPLARANNSLGVKRRRREIMS